MIQDSLYLIAENRIVLTFFLDAGAEARDPLDQGLPCAQAAAVFGQLRAAEQQDARLLWAAMRAQI